MDAKTLSLIWLVPGLPLAGFLFHTLLGKKAGRTAVAWLACLTVFASFGISVALLLKFIAVPQSTLPSSNGFIVTLFHWIDIGNLSVPFEFRLDALSLLMCLIVTGVGGLIHLYATGYMADDPDHARFFTYFNLFIAFMLTLVLANNLPVMFIGWEGVGLCSYLLIGFWYKDINNAKAGNKAFIVNRIGDAGFLAAMFLIYSVLSPRLNDVRLLSFDVIFSMDALQVFQSEPMLITGIGLLFLLAASGKSAQLPLYMWLPDAMAGPTPVSALIHAATMVTAGVVLVNRCAPFYETGYAGWAMLIMGLSTAIFAALIALGQTDIKKVLAYSTVSQLGFMFMACGAGAFAVGMFHVTTHAFFKALLFLGSGSVIMAMHHEQDMRRYGGLWKYLGVTFATILIGWLAISGVPPLAGFYSKDEILLWVHNFSYERGYGAVYFILAVVTAGLTAFYMTRLMALTFFGKPRWQVIPQDETSHTEPELTENTAPSEEMISETVEVEEQLPESETVMESAVETVAEVSIEPEEAVVETAETDEETTNEIDTPSPETEPGENDNVNHDDHHGHGLHEYPREPGLSILIPLMALAVLSLVGGYILTNQLNINKFLGAPHAPIYSVVSAASAETAEENHSEASLAEPAESTHSASADSHSNPKYEKAHKTVVFSSLGAAILGILLGLSVYLFRFPKFEEKTTGLFGLQKAAGFQFGYDWLMTNFIGLILGGLFGKLLNLIDRGIDGIVNGVGVFFVFIGKGLSKIQTGYVRTYALILFFGVMAIIGIVVFIVYQGGR